MNKVEVLNHWKYFLTLEKDLSTLKNYIEIQVDNYETYSFELSKLLQLSCSEIDSVCRLLCKTIDNSKDYFDESIYSGNIANYKETILKTYPNLTKSEIHIPNLSNNILPWEDWDSKNSPDWWVGYNKVKHYRHSCFKEANLKNTLFSMSALMIIILYLYRIVVSTSRATPYPLPIYFDCAYLSNIRVTSPNEELPDF